MTRYFIIFDISLALNLYSDSFSKSLTFDRNTRKQVSPGNQISEHIKSLSEPQYRKHRDFGNSKIYLTVNVIIYLQIIRRLVK